MKNLERDRRRKKGVVVVGFLVTDEEVTTRG